MSAIQLNQSAIPVALPREQNTTCWDTALKVQKISNRSFSCIRWVFYYLIDVLSRYFSWAKQKQVSIVNSLLPKVEEPATKNLTSPATIAKRAEIDSLVKKNFTLLASNVSHLDEAEVICFGETHTKPQHQINQTQLIDALCDEGRDLILQEYDESDPPKSLTEYQLKGLKHKNLQIKGWDKREPSLFRKYFDAEHKIQDIETLRSCLYSLSKLFAIPVGIHLFKTHQSWNTSISQIAINIIILLGCDLFLLKNKSTQIDKYLNLGELVDLAFPGRNRHMYKVVEENSAPDRKIYVIAGRDHLRIPPKYPHLSDCEHHDKYVVTNQETMEFLKKKKFAILINNDC